MPRKSTKTPETRRPAPAPADVLANGFDANRAMMDGFRSFQATQADGLHRFNDELLRFTIERLKKDRDWLSEIETPRDPVTAAMLWSSYATMAAQEYAIEARRLWGAYMGEVLGGMLSAQTAVEETMSQADEKEMLKSVPV